MSETTEARFRALDKYGWPVETIRGRPLLNALRLLIHTRRIARWKQPTIAMDPSVATPTTEGEDDG